MENGLICRLHMEIVKQVLKRQPIERGGGYMAQYAVLGRKEDVEKLEDKVPYTHMVCKDNLPMLIKNLKEEDQVWISSVEIFSSVNEFIRFSYNVQRKKASLQVLEQPALQFDARKDWEGTARRYLSAIVQAEETAIRESDEILCKGEEGEIMETMIFHMTIRILSRIFIGNGLPVWDREV